MYVKVNGTRLFFDVVGSHLQPTEQEMKLKPTLIVIHGGPGADHSYLRPLDPLGEVAQVIYLDLRGNGRSARHSNDYYRIGIMADDVAALCAELGIEKPIVLGHSFGGYVALTLAVRHPELLGGLILGSTSALGADFGRDLDLIEQVAGKDLREVVARHESGQASEEDERRMDEELFPLFWYPPKPELLASFFSRTIWNADIDEYMREEKRKEYDVRPHLAEIMVPTLILHGRYDVDFSLRDAEELAQHIPHAQLHVFEQAGHSIVDDATEEMIQVIRTFLETSLQQDVPSLSAE